MMGINHFVRKEMLIGYAQSRGLPSPKAGVVISGIMLFLGGLGVLLGAYIGWAVLILVVFLIAVSFGIHHFWNDSDPQQKMTEMTHFMKNMALAGAALMMLMIESWPLSLP